MTDWPDLLEPVARELLGEPSRRTTSGEWRYGRKGSLAVHVGGPRAGTWRDHEADAGGGVLDLLEHVEGIDRAEALDWLRRRGLLDGAQPTGNAASRLAGAGVAGHRGPPDNRSAGTLARCSALASAENRDLGPTWAETLWRRAVPIPAAAEHPARRWLAARHLWRPEMHLPPSVRWMPSEGGPAAGAVVAAFAAPGAGRVSAVHLVHVDGDGLPTPDRTGPDGLHKRSHGVMSGAVCVLGLVDAAAGVQVCEGLADGLALTARDPWPAVVMGGTANYRNRDLARWLAGLGPVQVWSDGDGPGVEASGVLAKRVAALGGAVSIERVGVGEDPGAAGAPFAPLDVATVEDYAADLERDGLPCWEALRLAATCTRGGE